MIRNPQWGSNVEQEKYNNAKKRNITRGKAELHIRTVVYFGANRVNVPKMKIAVTPKINNVNNINISTTSSCDWPALIRVRVSWWTFIYDGKATQTISLSIIIMCVRSAQTCNMCTMSVLTFSVAATCGYIHWDWRACHSRWTYCSHMHFLNEAIYNTTQTESHYSFRLYGGAIMLRDSQSRLCIYVNPVVCGVPRNNVKYAFRNRFLWPYYKAVTCIDPNHKVRLPRLTSIDGSQRMVHLIEWKFANIMACGNEMLYMGNMSS